MHQFIAIWFGWIRDWHYLGVFVMMAIESSIVPIPSELIIPPAAYWVTQGQMTTFGVVVAGTAGSYVGAMVMYVVSRVVGRAVILRWGKYFFIPPEKLEQAERFLLRYETGGVFFARLLPVVRHLIGIPAGIVRMSVGMYSLMTIVGSAIWCTILCLFGEQVLGEEPKLMDDPDALVRVLKHKSLSIIIAVAVLTVLYIAVVRMTRKPAPAV